MKSTASVPHEWQHAGQRCLGEKEIVEMENHDADGRDTAQSV